MDSGKYHEIDDSLTTIQISILDCLDEIQEKSTKEIADSLNMSYKTVSNNLRILKMKNLVLVKYDLKDLRKFSYLRNL